MNLYTFSNQTINVTTNETTNQFVVYSCQYGIMILIIFGILILPNLVTLIIHLITKTKLTKILALLNIIQNVGFSLVISSSICLEYYDDYIQGLIFGIWIVLIMFIFVHAGLFSTGDFCVCSGPFETLDRYKRSQDICKYQEMKRNGYKTLEEYYEKSCCSCRCESCQSPDDVLAPHREMKMLRVPREDLEAAMRENEENPPMPVVTSQAYYYTGGKNKRRVLVDEKQVPVEYGSWEEEGEGVELGAKPVQVYYCRCEYVMDGAMLDAVESLKAAAAEQLCNPTHCATVEFVDAQMDGLVSEVLSADNSCPERCCRSCWCNCAGFVIASFLGYSYPVSLWWRSGVDVVLFKSRKRMSSGKDLRANAGERLKRREELEKVEVEGN